MKVLIFGATGMVGQGVLREALAAPDVTLVQTVGRTATGVGHYKLRELVPADLYDLSAEADRLGGFDACFFCLGVSSYRMSEADYTRITYTLTMNAAELLVRLNPEMVMVFVSGSGTDATEQGRVMWARVKGKAENGLRRLPFRAVYAFRPGVIQPLHGARSKTPAYRIPYLLLSPFLPLMRRLFPATVLTTEVIGRAMLEVVRRGAPMTVLEPRDIDAIARRP